MPTAATTTTTAPLAVAGLQLDLAWEDPATTLTRARAAIATAAAAGSQLLVLPEMFAHGFSMQAGAMAAYHAEIAAFCAAEARAHGVWLLAGVVEPASPRPHNCAVLWGPDGGERGRYRKIHPFSYGGESEHYGAGAALPTWQVGDVRVTAVVCYDLRFVELFRAAAADTDLFVVIANWPAARWEHWQTLLRARAIECQAFVLGVNRVGEGGGLSYRGDSGLWGPFGEPLAALAVAPGLLLGTVAAAEVAAVRARTGFLADRRPAIYAGLRRG